jgi:hypothetical protein
MDYSTFKSFSEVMEVEKSVDVIHSETGKKYRIEVVQHAFGTATVHYAVNYYKSSDAGWVPYLNFPWINEPSAEDALRSALKYVAYRPQVGD